MPTFSEAESLPRVVLALLMAAVHGESVGVDVPDDVEVVAELDGRLADEVVDDRLAEEVVEERIAIVVSVSHTRCLILKSVRNNCC